MNRRRAGRVDQHSTLGSVGALGVAVAACLGCACDGPSVGELPAAPEPASERETRAVAPGPRDPRLPPDFDLPLPRDATVRYGHSSASEASVLVTTERPADAVFDELTRAFSARGWHVAPVADAHARPPGRWRDGFEALAGGTTRPVGSVVVSRGRAGITRVMLTQPLEDGRPFHAPPEPGAWRRVDRAPVPPPAGEPSRACVRAMRRACEALAAVGGPDALSCAMDHRGACLRTGDEGYAARAAQDAEARLRAALRAHDRVGSRGARAQTRAQVRVELLAARARAAASPEGARLARIIAAAEAEGHALAADPEELAAWFAGRPSPEAARLLGLSDEIPTTPRP